MAGPLGGGAGDPRASTTYVEDVDGRTPRRQCWRSGSAHHLCRSHRWRPPWEAVPEIWERPPPMSKTLMAGPLGGDVGDPGAPTIYVKDVDGEPPGR
jgi:hypothetical protein